MPLELESKRSKPRSARLIPPLRTFNSRANGLQAVEHRIQHRDPRADRVGEERIRGAAVFHDCVMVAESMRGQREKVMEEAFESATGARPVIKKTKCDLPRIERAA